MSAPNEQPNVVPPTALTKKDFQSDQDVRWCPGCGDYAILAQVQKVMPELGIPRENVVFVSGIGCSSRFPYYMNTYGFHGIHGRAPAIATGLKVARPELSVWVVTGDGDGLSIGGNHLIHAMRRNVDLKILLFNNRIYGLTKGQYSPTSEPGKRTSSTPMGSVDHAFVPCAFALGADATFVGRTADIFVKEQRDLYKAAHNHKGTSFVEVLQNCNIFNDGAFDSITEKSVRADKVIFVEHGKPMVFGAPTARKGLRLNGLSLEVIELGGQYTEADCLVHDETSYGLASMLARMEGDMPMAMGVIYRVSRPTYEVGVNDQIATAQAAKGMGDLQKAINGPATWVVSESK